MADLQGEMEKMTAKLRTSRNKADESLQQSNQAHEMSIALEEVEREREILKQVSFVGEVERERETLIQVSFVGVEWRGRGKY